MCTPEDSLHLKTRQDLMISKSQVRELEEEREESVWGGGRGTSLDVEISGEGLKVHIRRL